MLSRFTMVLFITLAMLGSNSVQAQSTDYLKHGKIFNLCSYKRQCTKCYTCDKDRFEVKIKNNTTKAITAISVKFYSEVFNRILEKDTKIEADIIRGKQIGHFYMCVPNGQHWIISKITYDDGSTQSFTLADRMEDFMQEPDECDCND